MLHPLGDLLLYALAPCPNVTVTTPGVPAIAVIFTWLIDAFSAATPPLDKVNGVPITIAVDLLYVGSQRNILSLSFAFLLSSLSVRVTGILIPDAQVLFCAVCVRVANAKPPTMLVEISLYLTSEDWPRIVGESTVTISDFFEPSQLPKTPVFTPPCSMSVSGCEPIPIDLVRTRAGSPL